MCKQISKNEFLPLPLYDIDCHFEALEAAIFKMIVCEPHLFCNHLKKV